jgi:hypothetical protein
MSRRHAATNDKPQIKGLNDKLRAGRRRVDVACIREVSVLRGVWGVTRGRFPAHPKVTSYGKEARMKYMLLIYGNPKSWGHPMFLRAPEVLAMSTDERDAMIRQFKTLHREITESGELVGGEALADPVNTRTVRFRDGVPAATDGPFIETKEQLAGYFVVDCESPERATEIAARLPDARFAAVEVSPIMDLSGQEM